MVVEAQEFDDRASRKRVSTARLLVGGVVLLLVGLVGLAIYQSYWVPKRVVSNSMFPTLRRGEFVFVDCRRGLLFKVNDVVMFDDPTAPGSHVTKRIIAREGQVVEWDGERLSVDGAELAQITPRIGTLESDKSLARKMDREARRLEVGPEEVFVLGDNWGRSYDSFDYGPVKRSQVLGVVRYVYWPLSVRRAVR